MVDKVASSNDQQSLQDLKSAYDKRRKQLVQTEEQKLSDLEQGYRTRREQIEKTGEKSVEQIRENSEKNMAATELQTHDQEKSRRQAIDLQSDNLKEYEKQQKAYTEQARKHQGDLTRQQLKDYQEHLTALKSQKETELIETGNRYKTKIQDAQTESAETINKVRNKSSEMRRNEQARSEHELRELEQRDNRLAAAEKSHAKEVVAQEKQNLSIRLDDVRKRDAKQTEEERGRNTKTQNLIEQKYNAERQQSEKSHAAETAAMKRRHTIETTNIQEHDRKGLEKQRLEYVEQVKEAQKDGETAVEKQKEVNKASIEKQKGVYSHENTEAEKRQLQTKMEHEKIYRAQLERDEKVYDGNLKNQKIDFDKKFKENQHIFGDSLRNQQVDFIRAMQNQKKELVEKFKVYDDVKSDPFYRIQDFPMDLFETEHGYIFESKIPEHERNNVQVRVQKDRVVLSGSRSFQDGLQEGEKKVQTASYQTFQQEYPFKHQVRENDVLENYENGVLKLYIPKI